MGLVVSGVGPRMIRQRVLRGPRGVTWVARTTTFGSAYGDRVRIGRLFTPGWLAMTLAVVVFASACLMLLAPWQLRRADERDARNTAIEQSFASPPTPVGRLLAPDQEPGPDTEWRQVLMTGRFRAEGEAVVRLRTVLGEPAYEVLTPFELSEGGTLIVNRGFVRPVEGTRVPAYEPPPAGVVTTIGRARADESDGRDRPAFDEDGHRQVYVADSRLVAQAAGITARRGYYQLLADQPGVLGALPLPELTSGPYFSYALQWAAFGIMAILGLLHLAWQEVTGRKSIATGGSRRDGAAAVRAVRSNPTDPPPRARQSGTAPHSG